MVNKFTQAVYFGFRCKPSFKYIFAVRCYFTRFGVLGILSIPNCYKRPHFKHKLGLNCSLLTKKSFLNDLGLQKYRM